MTGDEVNPGTIAFFQKKTKIIEKTFGVATKISYLCGDE
jgi:hypothetical protein